MRALRLVGSFAMLSAFIGSLLSLPNPAARGDNRSLVFIGIPQNLFRDFPKATVEALMPTFTKLMESQTGMKGKVILLSGPDEVRRHLVDNKVQLAVFHGFEFAWAQVQHDDLKPLVVVIKQGTKLQAQVIVAKESNIEKLEDLRGQSVCIPRGTPEHCRLFLSRRTRRIGQRMEQFFSNCATAPHVAAALDDVACGKVKATVVDSSAWENYQWMNPAKAAKLRPLIHSEPFPTGVIAYKEGVLPESELQRYRNGLVTAHSRPEGMQLMMLWKMKRFDVAPPDFQQTLAEIVKAYPPPIGDEQ